MSAHDRDASERWQGADELLRLTGLRPDSSPAEVAAFTARLLRGALEIDAFMRLAQESVPAGEPHRRILSHLHLDNWRGRLGKAMQHLGDVYRANLERRVDEMEGGIVDLEQSTAMLLRFFTAVEEELP